MSEIVIVCLALGSSKVRWRMIYVGERGGDGEVGVWESKSECESVLVFFFSLKKWYRAFLICPIENHAGP